MKKRRKKKMGIGGVERERERDRDFAKQEIPVIKQKRKRTANKMRENNDG